MKRMKNWLVGLLAVLLVVEEWIWDALTALGQWLSLRLRLQRLEEMLRRANRWAALLAFMVPLALVAPLNIYALWLIAEGEVMRGVVLEIIAKLLGTMLVARVFALTRQQLLTFRILAWVYKTVMGWLSWAHAWLESTLVYRAAKHAKARARAMMLKTREQIARWLR